MTEDAPMRLLNRRQVAEMLCVSERTIRRLVEKGDLPGPVHVRRAVRWPEAAVIDYLRRLPQGPTQQSCQEPPQ